jgi:hypothetical protein
MLSMIYAVAGTDVPRNVVPTPLYTRIIRHGLTQPNVRAVAVA